MISDLNTYLEKAIPDTKLTIQKYADCKFEYLSYCLKVKEMDDEEFSYAALQEQLYRVETGNYEYRLILRCRQLARVQFAKMRQDVLVKLELLDQKHVQDIIFQLHRFITAMSKYNADCFETMKSITDIFPIEVDLPETTFKIQNDQENTKRSDLNQYNDEVETNETDSADEFDENDDDDDSPPQSNNNTNTNVANLLGID